MPMCVGIGESCVHFAFPEAQFQKFGESGSNAQKHRKKTPFPVPTQAMRNFAPWDWSKLLSGLRHFLRLENVLSGKYSLTTADGEN